MIEHIPLASRKQVAAFLKPRPHDSHKGLFGTVVVIGGMRGMVGAPLIAARAAIKLGAGCVHAGLLADGAPAVDAMQPELMLHSGQDALQLVADSTGNAKDSLIFPKEGTRSNKSTGLPLARERHTMVLAIGCGMGTSPAARKLLADALHMNVPLVLDADALNLIASHPDLRDGLRKRNAAAVITPHPGEAARLLDLNTADVQAARVESARQLAEKLRCAVVLKGADSICVTHNGRIYLNKTGNPGMSSAGMGDALTGMIAAFMAQGLEADEALLLGVHLHGAAADALAEQGVTIGMTATEIIEWARWLLNQWI
jgi:hydroxyethylthiazole kinase-like uncharacterized protein yjeF